mmetsp:Transcript_25508/g.75954  ORF Transcript_25508/g.75954 Transcript_25508/m.75954 type:complete len:204 (+) Transcript_25508:6982-7593(+)
MLLEQLAQVPDRREQHLERLRGELHVADVRHGRVEQLLVVRLVHRGGRAEPRLLVLDEAHEGVDPGLRVGLDVVGELVLPVAGEGHQGDLDRLNVDAQPVDVDGRLQVRELVLHVAEEIDLLVELLLLRHGPPDVDLDALHDLAEAHAVLLEALDDVVGLLLQELLEGLVHGLRPEELVLHEGLAVLHALELRVVDELRDQRQ